MNPVARRQLSSSTTRHVASSTTSTTALARPKTFSIFASEVASLLNQHKFQTFSTTWIKVWERNDPASFKLAQGRNIYVAPQAELERALSGLEVLRMTQTPRNVSQVHRVTSEVKRVAQVATLADTALRAPAIIVSEAAKRSSPEAQALQDVNEMLATRVQELKQERQAITVLKQDRALTPQETLTVEKIVHAETKVKEEQTALASLVSSFAVETVLNQASVAQTEFAPIAAVHRTNMSLAKKELAEAATNLLRTQEPVKQREWAAKKEEAEKVYTESIQSAEDFLKVTATRKVSPEALNAAKHMATANYGRNAEAEFIEKEKIESNNRKTYWKKAGNKVTVYGRIDGFKNGRLIEVKTRLSRILDFVPEYEKLQMFTYMEMLDLEEASMIQVFKEKKKSITIKRDFKWWTSVVVPSFSQLEAEFGELVSTPSKQDELFQQVRADEKARSSRMMMMNNPPVSREARTG